MGEQVRKNANFLKSYNRLQTPYIIYMWEWNVNRARIKSIGLIFIA